MKRNCFSLCEFFKFTRAARDGGDRLKGRRKYKPRVRTGEMCNNCAGEKQDNKWQVGVLILLLVETLCSQECILCGTSYHNTCLNNWTATTIGFFLCPPCHAIEVAKEPE